LTAALSLQRYGFKVSVYEQASELREFGAGLLLTHALEFLGGEVIAATSNVSNEQLIRHFQSGEIVHRRPDGHYYMSKYGAGHFQVHRADLHNALKAAVLANDSDCVHPAYTFSWLSQSKRVVTAYFVNGMVVRGDALIGCNGSRSAVREAVYGSAPVSYSGQVAFRALIPCENHLPHPGAQGACMCIGPYRMFLHSATQEQAHECCCNLAAASMGTGRVGDHCKGRRIAGIVQGLSSLGFGDDWSYPA
jgi:2-polyprenyl-6-methoxyphenol hydroxylase-like FAD-dependent oxidoreductase